MDCRNCQTELTEMKNGKGETTCLRCLKCHPITAYVPPVSKESKYVDIKMTEDVVIEIIDRIVPDMIREVLENWHIQKPPLTVGAIREIAKDFPPTPETLIVPVNPELAANPNWRQRAKELGIELFQRKKVDVLKDIEDKLTVPCVEGQ